MILARLRDSGNQERFQRHKNLGSVPNLNRSPDYAVTLSPASDVPDVKLIYMAC
ncbi:hypothetical protein ACHAPT_003918 [Fusarium lateritium]